MKRFIERIAEKANNKFGETESKMSDSDNVIYTSVLASAKVARLLQINLRKDSELYFQSVRNLHHCTLYYQEPKYDNVYVLMDDYVSYAKGSLDFVEEVLKFIEAEEKDQENLNEVAKFRTLGSEYAAIVSSLRILVNNMIMDVELGIPLKGKYEACSKNVCFKDS